MRACSQYHDHHILTPDYRKPMVPHLKLDPNVIVLSLFPGIQDNIVRHVMESPDLRMGGMNMNNLMKQAQKMQKQMMEKQEELQAKTLEMTSGGGAVKVVITGKKEIQELKINPDVVDPDDVEMLEDLIISAVNEAIRQVEEMNNAEMGRMTGGLGGMF